MVGVAIPVFTLFRLSLTANLPVNKFMSYQLFLQDFGVQSIFCVGRQKFYALLQFDFFSAFLRQFEIAITDEPWIFRSVLLFDLVSNQKAAFLMWPAADVNGSRNLLS